MLALVVLPILPERVNLDWLEIRPRALWMVVLLFCALNFAGFVAHRKAGRGRGYLLTGLIGGQPGVEPWLLVQGGRATGPSLQSHVREYLQRLSEGRLLKAVRLGVKDGDFEYGFD